VARLELRDVHKRYRDVVAVAGVSADIADGEFFCILGPSGCGKSSLLRMVGGLEDLTEGEVVVDGEKVHDVRARDRNMAMVFEAFALYPHLSVWDNVAFPLRIRGLPKPERERRIRWALELVDLSPQAHRNVRRLSEGQKQRTSLARAIVREPVVFLLDEPVSHVEARIRTLLRSEIIKLHRTLGITTLYVTHDQAEALSMADRVAVMLNGLFHQVGPPHEIYDRPASLPVARFVGEPPMNLLEGELLTTDGGVAFRTNGTTLPLDLQGRVLASHEGPAVLGVRPEDVVLAGPDAAGIPARTTVLESHGDVAFLFAETSGAHLQVEVAADTPAGEGERVVLVPQHGRIHLYDRDSGQTLLREAAHG
jgi:ABC-type sugar transport system ATPase subunit